MANNETILLPNTSLLVANSLISHPSLSPLCPPPLTHTFVCTYPERGGTHMISTDDLEYPREYRTLGNARRFSNVGLVHTSEHRHTVTAAQSLEALTNLHKADMERKRDAFMDHLKSKYQQQQQQLQHHSPHHTPPSPSPSHGSMSRSSERAAREAREAREQSQEGVMRGFSQNAHLA
ncbi:hypothetical protein WMY93_003893 [Mugilogobius chulae]|uniref:Uncharacterized protein n=1 Tax=Mugilogobius chulae TaxID=88201 RepID=A0AAW0Q7U9_9GOBI